MRTGGPRRCRARHSLGAFGAFGALYSTHIVTPRTPNSYGVIRDELRISSTVHARGAAEVLIVTAALLLPRPPLRRRTAQHYANYRGRQHGTAQQTEADSTALRKLQMSTGKVLQVL